MKNKKVNKRLLPAMTAIKELEVGEDISFPLEKMSSIKSTATTVGTAFCKRFKTSVNREGRTITVTRME